MKLIVLVFFYFASIAIVAAQNNDLSKIAFIKSKSGFVYSDNSPDTYFTLEFLGDPIQPFDNGINAFNIGRNFYQILKHNYTSEQYTNKAKHSKEEELLLYFKKYEADYHSKEIYKQPLTISEEFFTNSDEKKFHLWYFPQPAYVDNEDSTKEQHELTTWHVYLSFVANKKVAVVYSPILENKMSIEQKVAELKSVAESANIFGGRIDESALSYKITSANEEGFIEFVDPLGKYYIAVPEWLNITQSTSDGMLLGTLPDIHNVKNAISIEWFEKSEFNSIEDFNNAQVLQYKMGDVINGTHTFLLRNEYKNKAENQGLSYKVQLTAGDSLYNTHVVTYETSSGYLLCRFVATQETYKRNLPKFFEFINSIVLE